MKHIFHSLINLGIESSLSASDRRRIKTINVLNLFVAFCLLVGLCVSIIIQANYPVFSNFIFFGFSIFSLWLNKRKLSFWAFFIFTFYVNGAIFFINQYYPQNSGSYLYYYNLIISVALLSNPSRFDRFATLHLVVCGLFFAGNLLLDLPINKGAVFSEEKMKIMWYFNLVISSIITVVMSVMLTRLIYNQNQEIIVQNKDLLLTREEVRATLKEKEILLAELHHRVKNNLAIITGLLNLQEDATNNEEARQALNDSKARIMSMALVHKMLYDNSNLKSIQIDKYIHELVMELFNSCNLSKKVKITFNCANIVLPVSKSIPLGLIINEIVTNSIKYVYRAQPNLAGEFAVSILTLGDDIELIIKDNGPGFPINFNPDSEDQSLGIYLIKTLTEQIDGRVNFSNDKGAQISLTFNAQ